ncbi:Hypothetical protein IALB_1240 [Ignavibacterium album JCM 16511]|uniref:DUF6745 domain-containing protein n=1 Tax=Ignavibacterium album (strain DSM 19864 / JCM 16511 / NBRC 101810 / Mat9-16) TaxID=945713 RepID=I0AIZ4_IGNAJ|nr:hypothetical protein [Ignavibacterium album]AFH48951.1 Hypothetical protein IALB_1240 [Ignavibacterium album JCM 16511]
MSPYMGPRIREADRVDKINEYLRTGNIETLKKERTLSFFYQRRFDSRLKEWENMFRKIENANVDNYHRYTVEWIKSLGCRQKPKEIEESFEIFMLKGTLIDQKNKTFEYPYSAAINFYNRLADIFYNLGLWYHFMNVMVKMSLLSVRWRSIFMDKSEEKRLKETKEFYGENYKPYHLPIMSYLDRFFFCACESMYYALGGYIGLDNFKLDNKVDSDTFVEKLSILSKAIDAGLDRIYVTNKNIGYTHDLKTKVDSEGELHCEDGPAFQSVWGEKGYCYHGIRLDERVIMHPEQLSAEEIISSGTLKIKNVMIEKYGLGKFVEEAGYIIVDEIKSDKKIYQLLSVDIKENEPVKVMKIVCLKTYKTKYLRVKHDIRTFEEAMSWSFGLRGMDLNFYSET